MRNRRDWLVIPGLALGLTLAGCTPKPPPLPDAAPAAAAVVSALITGDWSGVQFTGPADQAVKEYGIVTAGMRGLRPATVTYGAISYNAAAKTASVPLNQTYSFSKQWTFDSVVTLQYDGANWLADWAPTIVHPSLDGYTRLKVSTEPATRGSILGRDGSAIVWNRPVFNVGIDKTKVSGAEQAASARALAQVVGIDPDGYAAAVANGGPQQFVIAITYRAGQVPAAVMDIPGAYAQPAVLPLAPSRMFAIGLLGSAGEATAEDIDNGHGSVQVGDVVGHSGLQLSQNEALSGIKGYTVYLAPRNDGDVMAPTNSASPTPSAPAGVQQVLFQADPMNGSDLHTTLDEALQTKAEAVLAGQDQIASLVVLDAQTGGILASANSPAAGGYSYATLGRYAPGSTFKVATALALLRSGMTPDSPIDCPTSVVVDGKPFQNDADFAPSHNGTITLRQAVAWSCNTAMVNGSRMLGDAALADAAASLGLGVDRSLGFQTFLGSVPPPASEVEKAADAFGQGKIEMSPLAMATEAASVAAGRTAVPYLLVDPAGQPIQPSGTAAPTSASLTPDEAAALQSMMAAVVDSGTGTVLKGLVRGAKTGTAEFMGDDGQLHAHAWMIAYTDQYAIAAFVTVGVTGATTAGPLIKAFLTT